MGKYFGTDGIRGNANEKLTVDMAFKVGRFIGDYYGKERAARIVIGKDTRLSSGMFETALAAGISASGGNVYLIGYCSTPCLAYLTGSEDFDCGVMISASHNPFHDNGIKLFSKSGLKIQEDIENLIETYIDHPEGIALKTAEKIGNVYNFSEGLNIYKNWLCGLYKMDLKGMKILLDLANGSNCFTAVDVLRHYGADVLAINDHPDGININTNCGSTHLETLQEKMREGNYDIGFAFDGDADRVLTVDCHGEVVDGDKAMFALGLFEKANGSLNGNTVVTTVMSNIGLFKALAKHDINVEVTAVGDKNVVDAMVKNDYCIGGEQSGHIINKHHCLFGDGLKTALNLLYIMDKTGKNINELTDELIVYPQLLVNEKVKDKAIVLNDEEIQKLIAEIGKRLGDDGRILVRPSGTEPLIRVMVEAKDEATCQKEVYAVIDLIKAKGYSA